MSLSRLKENNYNFSLMPKQGDFLEAKERFIVNSGGVGSGKTYSIVLRAIKHLVENPGVLGLIGAQTFPQLRETTLRDFITLCPPSFIANHNKSTNSFKFINGSELLFWPFDDPNKLKSLNLGFVGIEEMSDVKEDIFKMLRTRIRQKIMDNPCIFGATNPAGFSNWVYKYFIESPIPNSRLIYSQSKENRHLPADYLADLESLKHSNPEYYARMVQGKWGSLSGLVYNLPREAILKKVPEEFHRIIAGLDFGFDHPTAILIIGIIEKTYFIIDEVYKRGLTAGDITKELKVLKKTYNPDIIYCDSARPEIIEDLKRQGFPAAKSNKDVFLGIMEIKSLLGSDKLFISENCPNLIKEFDNYVWDKDAIAERPIKLLDDCLDSLRYAIFTDKKKLYRGSPKKLSWA
jgi:phage terminase large subunit